MLLVPALTEPVISSKETHLLTHYTMHLLGIVESWMLAALLAAMFAELHHYYHECGGLVSASKNVCGVTMSRVVLAVVISTSVVHVAYSLANLSALIERQTDYYFADHYKVGNLY